MNITLIEDDILYAQNIGKKLKKNGYGINIFNNEKDFLNNSNNHADLYIIDLNLGNGSGLDIIKYLRKKIHNNNPIIIISAYNDTERKVYGLDIGADDYLPKPFTPEELLARVRALLRRGKQEKSSIMKFKNIIFNSDTKKVKVARKDIHLTTKETQLLEVFLLNKGKLIQKSELTLSVWGDHEAKLVTDNTINVTISKLRNKLGNNFSLKTIINGGYLLVE